MPSFERRWRTSYEQLAVDLWRRRFVTLRRVRAGITAPQRLHAKCAASVSAHWLHPQSTSRFPCKGCMALEERIEGTPVAA